PWCVRQCAEHSFGPAVDCALGCNELYRALPGFFGDLWKTGSLLLCGSKVHPVARPCLPTRHPEAAEPTVSVKKKQRTTRGGLPWAGCSSSSVNTIQAKFPSRA